MIILVIDDDADDYEMFYETLMSIDKTAKCVHAFNGEQALNLLENTPTVLPDFIFLDVNMPIMGGKECLENLKERQPLKDIPVVMYSTTANPVEINAFYTLGATKFVVKPSTFEELTRIIRDVIKST